MMFYWGDHFQCRMSWRASVGLFQTKLIINRANVPFAVDKGLSSISAKNKEESLFLPVTSFNKNLCLTDILLQFFFEISRLNINTDLLCSVVSGNILLRGLRVNLRCENVVIQFFYKSLQKLWWRFCIRTNFSTKGIKLILSCLVSIERSNILKETYTTPPAFLLLALNIFHT